MSEIKVYENITIGTVIVFDIRKLIGISKSTYIKLSPSSLTQFFRLDNITGNLYSISSIDLETSNLCNTERSCCPNHQYEQVTNQLDTTTNDNNNNQYSINQLNYHSEDLSNNLNQCRLTTFILASADNEIQISPIAKLHVHIIDLNDNPPQFNVFSDYQTNYRSKSIHLSFLEGSLGVNTKHDLPRAFDADFSIINRVKNYWIEWDDMNHGVSNNLHQSSMNTLSKSSSISTITHTNGQIWSKLGPFRLIYTKSIENLIIQLDQELDREEQFIYKLRLIAQDGGDLRGSIQLIIEVDDVNEFPPIFIDSDYDDNQMKDSRLFSSYTTQEIYKKQYKVKESLDIGSRIGQLKAIDYDLSMSNETTDQITYHFSSNQMNWDVTHIFHLDSQTGILTLKHSLDYESVKNYRLTIIAQDGPVREKQKDPSKSFLPITSTIKKSSQIIYSSTALIDIIVLDVNDNLPMIYFDNDQIIENKQKIITGSSKALVTPSQSYEIWIKENIPKHTPIIFFNVIDRDTGQNSRISCQLLNSTDIFSIHELSDLYRIETQSLLDREYIDQYTIIIQCNDMGEPMLYNTKSLIIHLIDVNDSPPSFPLNMYHYHVLENSSPGTPVQPISTTYPTTIIATDSDLNNTLIYRLEPIEMIMLKNQSNYKENYVIQSLDYQLFSIDPNNGQIFTQGDLDREKKSTLEFCVCVDDSLHLTCIKVLIDLDDINDNPPQFQHDTYIIHLDENKQYYKPIIIFIVTDLDSNNKGFKFNILLDSNKPPEISTQQNDSLKQFNHSKFQKSIELNEHSNQNLITKYFTLRDNGLYLQNVLDREERANYHFYIQVQDVHNELSNQLQYNLTSQTEVFIHVNDINDNIPTFIFPNGSTSAGNRLITSCHEMIGSSIGQIQGYDPDLGINGTIIYHLMMTTSYLKQSLFHLDNNTGELFINSNQLNQFCGQSITLLISIDDQGPQLSKIGKHSTMEHLIIQLDDMPIKNQQLSQKWRINHNSLLESNVFTSTNMNSNTSTLTAKTILSITLGSSTIFLIGLLMISTILLIYSKSKRRKSFLTLKKLHLKDNTTYIQHSNNGSSSNNNNNTINDDLICMDCKQGGLNKILFPTNDNSNNNNNQHSNEYITKTTEHYPISMSKPKSISEDEFAIAAGGDDVNDDDNVHHHHHHTEKGNVRIHSHLYNPHTTYTSIGLHHCPHDSNSVNIPRFKDNNSSNNNDNKHYTFYPNAHLPSFILATHCLGQSSSLLSTPSLSPLQQKKRQLHTSPSSSSPPNGIECRQSCIGDQSKYISNVIVDHRNNCMITPGCFISNGAETELPTLKTLTQQQQQQHNDRIQPIPVKLNIQSHCDNLQNQLDNDQGRLNGSQQIFENNDKYNITQDYQRINKCGYEKPPLGRPSSRSLLNINNNNSNSNNNNTSEITHRTQNLHEKLIPTKRIPKNVSFIPSMPCFDNYPLKKTLDNDHSNNNNNKINSNGYFMNSSILKSTSGNYEICDHQHLYQFKSHPNILAYTTDVTIDDLHLNDTKNISPTSQLINPQLSLYNNKRNFLYKQNQLPPPPPLPPFLHRFLTPPCTRRFPIQSNGHIKLLPGNNRNDGYIKEKQCHCTLSNINKLPNLPKFTNLGLLYETENHITNSNNVMNTTDHDNQERGVTIHDNIKEMSNFSCCDYMSNYESEICSQCQLINLRNSPTPPIHEAIPYSTTMNMRNSLNDCPNITICNTDPIPTTTNNTTHSIISSDSLCCTNNNCPLFHFSNEKDDDQHNEYMHHLDYSTNSLTTIQDMFNSCV
uniref:Cadherin n=1 Tax=Schistosoma mansoni TaxID=6183 RepID=A0A5K4FAB7_SCHMA